MPFECKFHKTIQLITRNDKESEVYYYHYLGTPLKNL